MTSLFTFFFFLSNTSQLMSEEDMAVLRAKFDVVEASRPNGVFINGNDDVASHFKYR